jgi:hypothetical protein
MSPNNVANSAAYAGIDYSSTAGPFQDQVDLTFTEIVDPIEVIVQDVIRAVTTPQGDPDLLYGQFWSPDSIDLTQYVQGTYTEAQLDQIKSDIDSVFYNELRYAVNTTVNIIKGVPIELQIDLQVYPSTDTTPIVITFVVGTNGVTFSRSP